MGAIETLSAVPASTFHSRRFGISYVYFASETRRWYGVSRVALADLDARLGREEPEAYSLWCSEHGGDALPFVATDRDGGVEENFTVAGMDDAEDLARAWVERVGGGLTRLGILAPDGHERFVTVGSKLSAHRAIDFRPEGVDCDGCEGDRCPGGCPHIP